MSFFSVEFCKILQAAGIVNESGFNYVGGHPEPITMSEFAFMHPGEISDKLEIIPAYVAEIAFLGPSETARENAKKWFGKPYGNEFEGNDPSRVGRLMLNNLDTTKESVEDFLRRTRGK